MQCILSQAILTNKLVSFSVSATVRINVVLANHIMTNMDRDSSAEYRDNSDQHRDSSAKYI